MINRKLFFATVSLAGFMLLSACGTVPITGRRQLSLVSDQEVLALSNQSFNSFMKGAKVSASGVAPDQVQRVGRRIASAVDQYLKSQGVNNDFDWQFVLVKDDVPNAFALPGGKVVVNEGLLPYTRDDDGLAVVLGHEIAHVIAKHSSERLSQQMLLNYGGVALDALMQNKSTATQTLASTVYGLGGQMGVMLPYSRKHEYEADKLGLIFMAMGGFDVHQAPLFWSHMMQQSGSKSTPEFLSTHPTDTNRIKQIQAVIPEALKYKQQTNKYSY